MNQIAFRKRIDAMRTASRDIVLELGFMQRGLAGTELSPSAVHTIIELGYGTITTATALGDLLHLEKSSVSRLVHKLKRDGLIKVAIDPADKRSRRLELTHEGQKLLRKIECFGRQQLSSALDGLAEDDVNRIDEGLRLFATALLAENRPNAKQSADFELFQGYKPTIVASVTYLHALYYSENYGFDAVFERKVATEMSEFMGRIDNPLNTTLSAYRGSDLLGSVSLDGEDLGVGSSHLRWFIVSPDAQGLGIGNLLLEKATSFLDEMGFQSTRLWTFKGLDAARYLYEKHGFELVQETLGRQWGKEVIEQEFERRRS